MQALFVWACVGFIPAVHKVCQGNVLSLDSLSTSQNAVCRSPQRYVPRAHKWAKTLKVVCFESDVDVREPHTADDNWRKLSQVLNNSQNFPQTICLHCCALIVTKAPRGEVFLSSVYLAECRLFIKFKFWLNFIPKIHDVLVYDMVPSYT